MLLRQSVGHFTEGLIAATVRTTAAMVAILILLVYVAPVRAADAIEVQMDNARLLKVPEGTDTIVVGNPLIADVTVQRNQVMVVTGKNFGTTNMIALDNKGAIISESQIIVMSPQKDRLIVVRGFDQETYACNPDCGPVLQIGDSDKHFARSGNQSRERTSTANAGNSGAQAPR